MARKGRKVLRFPSQQSSRKPVVTRKVSDRERLILEPGIAALDAVVQQANVAFEVFVRSVMITAKCNPEEGWMFNRVKMQWEKHAVPKNA
jgi:hypothetical protein